MVTQLQVYPATGPGGCMATQLQVTGVVQLSCQQCTEHIEEGSFTTWLQVPEREDGRPN
jgi:hypothetical protein